jgi:hypothetical protein
MTASRLWMVGCLGFAGLSAFLAISLIGSGFNQYGENLHCRFVTAQRDVLFKLIPELRPMLTADQIVVAASAAREPVQRTTDSIRLNVGLEFHLRGTEVNGVHSTNF